MNKLDSKPLTPSFAISPASHSDPEPARRLIVLFPASETDTPNLSHRIWEIAQAFHLNVLLLSLSNNFDEEPQLRRKLINMAAFIKDPNVSTEIMIEHGNDWVRQVRKIRQAGDIVACYAGQKTGLLHKPLEQILRSSLDMTVYILTSAQSIKSSKSMFHSQVLFWLGSLAILGGFLWVEMGIIQMPQDWTHTALIYVCVSVEFALILLWNSMFT